MIATTFVQIIPTTHGQKTSPAIGPVEPTEVIRVIWICFTMELFFLQTTFFRFTDNFSFHRSLFFSQYASPPSFPSFFPSLVRIGI